MNIDMNATESRPPAARPARRLSGYGTHCPGVLLLTFLVAVVGHFGTGAQAGDVILNEIHYHPQSGNQAEEWIEIYNRGTNAFNLAGWRFTKGIQFELPAILLSPGNYLVVCADTNAFTAANPGVKAVGNWTGSLSDGGEMLRLEDAENHLSDEVPYASEGDWAQRWKDSLDGGFRGWTWASLPDGLGGTLERVSVKLDSDIGQNWSPSNVLKGTPGAPNSAGQPNVPPFILHVRHHPAVPRSTNTVTVTADIRDESATAPAVSLFHRVDGAAAFTQAPMFDDGLHGDGAAGDGKFGAILPARTNGTVVEFYVQAADAALTRTWPQFTFGSKQQLANCLYQVDDEPEGTLPRYRIILTAAEKETLRQIDELKWFLPSNARMNCTFIATEGGDADIRYRCGVRQRGTTSRDVEPASRQVAFPNDDTWRGLRAINLNGVRPHSQVMGAMLARLAGLPAARSRLVEVRENGVARSGSATPVPGLFAHNEEVDAEFCNSAFPGDGGGNLYGTSSFADLKYLGEAKTNYSALYYYTKETNRGLDDWSDLIQLTRTLSLTADASYAGAVRGVADPLEWARYFAFNYVVGNTESCLAYPSFRDGVWNTGDYLLYRGEQDTRFRLVPYDFDSVLGTEGGDVPGPYTGANVAAIARFLKEPEFGNAFHAEVRRLSQTVLSPEAVSALIDRLLAPHIPEPIRVTMKAFANNRPNVLAAALPPLLSTTNTTALTRDAVILNTDHYSVGGLADPGRTRTVRVRGLDAVFDPLTGHWSLDVPLNPGMNRLEIEGFDAAGQRTTNWFYNVWREVAAGLTTGGTLAADTVWKASQSPIVVASDLVIPAGRTLTIEPGTTVSLASKKGITVQGRLLAQGTPTRRIYIGVSPVFNASWRGISFVDSTNENRLVQVDLGQPSSTPLWLTNSVATFEGLTFPGLNGNALTAYASSLIVRGCRFPSVTFGEPVGVLGARAGGRVLFDGNVFGTTIGYADVIEASLLKRPGPILEVYNNTFLGGGDDGLDLDGCDAHIEGNTFMHFHKDASNASTSISSAIAVGVYEHGETSDLTVVRNVFVGNDHDFEFKQNARLDVRQNTFLNGLFGSVSFSEPLRPGEGLGKSAHFNGCIWSGYTTPMVNVDPGWISSGAVDVRIDNSILSQPGPWVGTNVLATDPLFVDPAADRHLQAASPARQLVPPGFDAGAYVTAGPVLLDRPAPSTDQRNYTLRVAGTGITKYRFTFDGSAFSSERALSTPLVLNSLKAGSHTVRIYGFDLAGNWQSEPGESLTWEIVAPFAGIEISEILADNPSQVKVGDVFTDLVELHNPGTLAIDLGDMSLTDDNSKPRKFVFPAGTTLPGGGYLVLLADKLDAPAGFHLGFGLDADGDELFLYDNSLHNNVLLDSVRFGPQLTGRSIGRALDGNWTLCNPSFGALNTPALLGDPRRIRINEFLANPGSLSKDEFVELVNPQALPVALGGLSIANSPYVTDNHVLPPLGFMEAKSYLALKHDADGDAINLPREFGVVALFSDRSFLVDSVAYSSQAPDVSEGRSPDATGRFAPLVGLPTPGAANPFAPADPAVLSWSPAANASATQIVALGAQIGRVYRLESTAAIGGTWQTESTTTAAGTSVSFQVSVTSGNRFFRVVAEP